MKTTKKLVLLLMVLILPLAIFNSCSSDDDGGSGGSTPSGVLKVSIDGSSWKSLEISSSATISNSGTHLTIIATNSDGKAVSMNVFGYEGVGTYEFNGNLLSSVNTASYTETNVDLSNPLNSTTEIWSTPYEDAVLGSISISEETDTKIIGTFNFKAKNPNDNTIVNLTDGSFNLNKQVQ